MKIYKYTILIVSVIITLSCNKDFGNYAYQDINQLTIQGVNATYSVRREYDTLKINPQIQMTMDDNDSSRYEYMWILNRGTRLNDTIGRSKNLSYHVLLNPATYPLYYRVKDKVTGVVWRANVSITVGTAFSRGILLMGEDEEGYAEAQILAMVNQDTLLIPNVLSNSGLPRLHGPVSFFHTGSGLYEADTKLWAYTHSGSYYLDRITLKSTTGNIFHRFLYMSENIDPETLHPVVAIPQIITAAGAPTGQFGRAIVTKAGDLFASSLFLNGGDLYNNPVNRMTAGGPRLLVAPYLMYMMGSTSQSSFMWFDKQNKRFLNYPNFTSAISVVLNDTKDADNKDPIFPWNNAALGRDLVYAENTRNTDGGSTNGNTFAIMKDAGNTHFVYKFYVNGANPLKRSMYTILPMAIDFDKADFYAFSSRRTVIFYAVGSKLYCYDYNPGNERFYEYTDTQGDEITMLKFDTQIDYVTNSLYVATYNNSTKGTLRRFTVGTNPDRVELLPVLNAEWSNLVKIKDFKWRPFN